MTKRRIQSLEQSENFYTRYRAKIEHIGFNLNIEQSNAAREKYVNTSEMNSRAKELFLADIEKSVGEK